MPVHFFLGIVFWRHVSCVLWWSNFLDIHCVCTIPPTNPENPAMETQSRYYILMFHKYGQTRCRILMFWSQVISCVELYLCTSLLSQFLTFANAPVSYFCGVCVCVYVDLYLLQSEDQVFLPTKWGHFSMSSQLQRAIWWVRLGFKGLVKIRFRLGLSI